MPQLSFAEVGACRWRWWAQRPGEAAAAAAGDGWRDLGCDTQHYTPQPEDEGCVLRVECTPTAPRRGPAAGEAGAAAAAGAKGEGEEEEAWPGETVAAVTGRCGRVGMEAGRRVGADVDVGCRFGLAVPRGAQATLSACRSSRLAPFPRTPPPPQLLLTQSLGTANASLRPCERACLPWVANLPIPLSPSPIRW